MPISTETCPGDARARPIPDIGEVGALDDSNPSHRDEADLGQPSVGDRAAYDDMAGISPRQLYAQGTAAGISGRGVEVLCGLAQLWMLTRILGPVGYGRIILALTIVQIATLVCACGLERLILFRLSRDTAPPGQLTGHALAGTALAWGLVVACGLGVAIWAAAPGFAAAFDDPSLVFFLRGLSGLVPLQLAICLQAAWHQARQRLPESQLVGRTGPEVVAATLLAGVWLGGGGAVAVVAAIVASRALVAGLWWVRHPLWPARGEIRSTDALFALKTSANGLVFQGLRYSDLIMVGLFMSPESVGLYAVVSRLAMLANLGRSMLAPIFEPRIGFLLRRDQPGALAGEYHHVRILALLVALGLAVPLIGFNTTILHWFGYEAGYPVLLLLIGAAITPIAFGHNGMLLIMAGHAGWSLATSAVLLAVNIALNALWIPVWGVLGAACATLTATIAVQVIRALLIRRLEGLATMNVSMTAILGLILAALIAGAVGETSAWIVAAIIACAVVALAGANHRTLSTAIDVLLNPSGRRA